MAHKITRFERFTVSAASGLWQGCRERQEDAAAIWHSSAPEAAQNILAVLADGVGGLRDGNKASRILVSSYGKQYKTKKVVELQKFLILANERLHQQKSGGAIAPDAESTLIALSITDEGICWQSVGDSLLYRRRAKQLQRLNTAHTLGTEIDRKLKNHEISWEAAAAQEDNRDVLTSVVSGDIINEVEFRTEEVLLGDRYIIASDGLQPLIDHHWEPLLDALESASATQTCDILIQELKALNAPQQDNVAIIVIDITRPAPPLSITKRFAKFLRLLLHKH